VNVCNQVITFGIDVEPHATGASLLVLQPQEVRVGMGIVGCWHNFSSKNVGAVWPV